MHGECRRSNTHATNVRKALKRSRSISIDEHICDILRLRSACNYFDVKVRVFFCVCGDIANKEVEKKKYDREYNQIIPVIPLKKQFILLTHPQK